MDDAAVSPEAIRTAVKTIVATITEREPAEITDTAHFIDELGIDSLSAIELMVSVNRKYKIQIMDEEFLTIRNVNDAVAAVLRHVAAARGEAT